MFDMIHQPLGCQMEIFSVQHTYYIFGPAQWIVKVKQIDDYFLLLAGRPKKSFAAVIYLAGTPPPSSDC